MFPDGCIQKRMGIASTHRLEEAFDMLSATMDPVVTEGVALFGFQKNNIDRLLLTFF